MDQENKLQNESENTDSATPPYMPSNEQSRQPEQNEQPEPPKSTQSGTKPELYAEKTSGISAKKVANTRVSIQFVILIAFIAAVVAFLAGWFGYQLFIVKSNDVKLNETAISQGTNSTSTSESTSSSKMTMLKINQVAKYSWESDPKVYGTSLNIPNIAYSLGSAFRVAADVPDVGGSVGQYTGKEWVAIEVKATDNRTSGQSRPIYYVDNMRLAENGNKVPPVEDFTYIKPLETKTIYVVFPVDKSSNSFELMMGDLAKPSLFEIDFTKGVKQTGYFTMRGGYSETQ